MHALSPRFVALASLALAVTACDRWMPGEEEPEEPPRLVVTGRAVVDDAVDRVELLGDVHGAREVRVFAQVPERIRVLHVEEGDPVEAGDPIATLDADLQASSVQQASAALGAAEAARDQLRADVARVRRLVSSGALPRSQLETLETQLRSSEAQVDQMRAARRTAGEQRARTVVRAPIDGTVALLSVQQGDMVAPQAPICSVVRTESLVVKLQVTEQDYVRIREGMDVRLVPPALPDVQRTGTVTRISPVLNPMTRTALVEVSVANEDGVLRPGMVAEASIELSRRSDVVLAPSRALVLDSETDTERTASVFVVDAEAGVARRRRVVLGPRYGGRVEITEGLEGGETLVVQGQHLLRDGAPIRTGEPDGEPVARAEGP
ncbi:MAG TPA: efflux RND transporter periplasmic adaptor subunit [Sandaracinaceae bacterium LLY-WYZ-13_1]|nr:efflux RND transporter periplasmic adaptor subunit [Sandaracinaceae bacterium LLY-WYZ-13_1]